MGEQVEFPQLTPQRARAKGGSSKNQEENHSFPVYKNYSWIGVKKKIAPNFTFMFHDFFITSNTSGFPACSQVTDSQSVCPLSLSESSLDAPIPTVMCCHLNFCDNATKNKTYWFPQHWNGTEVKLTTKTQCVLKTASKNTRIYW